MALTDDEVKKSFAILKAFDEALSKGPWGKTIFFQAIAKRLKEARDRFVKEVGLEAHLQKEAEKAKPESPEEAQRHCEIYISLYQSDGANMRKWAVLLESLPKQYITRAIYAHEEHIRAAIRAKEYKHNDAYVVVRILKEAILPPGDKPQKDRLGQELLLIKENEVTLQNITRFVHVTGQYLYVKGVLEKQGPAEGL